MYDILFLYVVYVNTPCVLTYNMPVCIQYMHVYNKYALYVHYVCIFAQHVCVCACEYTVKVTEAFLTWGGL